MAKLVRVQMGGCFPRLDLISGGKGVAPFFHHGAKGLFQPEEGSFGVRKRADVLSRRRSHPLAQNAVAG